MSAYMKDKDKNEILNAMVDTGQVGSPVHEQQKMGIIVRSVEDIEASLKSLEESMNNSAASNSQLASKVFWLNVVLTAATVIATFFTGYGMFFKAGGQ